MGGLLAIPPNMTPESLGIKTKPALKMFYPLQDYGAYVADDTAWNAHAIETENDVLQEFHDEYGYKFGDNQSQFFRDVMKMFTSLHVVANNGPKSVVVGDEPRVPVAPPIDTSHIKDLQKRLDTVEDTFRADFNSDCKQDLLWRNLATRLNQVWLQDSKGKALGGGNILPLADQNWQIKSAADVDKDGCAEIIWENSKTGAAQTWHLDNLTVRGSVEGHAWMKNRDGLPRITFSKKANNPGGNSKPDPMVPVKDKVPTPLTPKDDVPDPKTPLGEKQPKPTAPTDDRPTNGGAMTMPSDEQVVGEYETLMVDDKWQTVSLDNSYDNPVVIVSDPTINGGDPAVIRIQDITGNTFQLRLQEPSYRGGQHNNEKVSYMVMEAGDWALDNGARISAGTLDSDTLTSDGFDETDLTGFNDTPAVLSQVQTTNGRDWVTTRMTDQSKNGFDLAMQEEERMNGGGHAKETIGWLAVDQGVIADGDTLLQGGMTGRSVGSNGSSVTFEQAFDAAPSVIAKLGSFYGGDTANLRLDNISNVSFGARVHEEQSKDSEIAHTNESIAYIALEGGSGTLTDYSV